MDYDDNDFQKQNPHITGEASNSKFPQVVQQPYALPNFDFDDTIDSHLRFDSLAETEGFLGNEDSDWIEDFSRGSSGIVFSSGATESCAISRHNNVWSEATSLESVEMLLNSVGQEEVVARGNTIKKSDTLDELGCTMELLEPDQINHDNSLSRGETSNAQPNTCGDYIPDDSSVLKPDDGHEQVLVKNDSPTVSRESSMEEKNAVLTSDTITVEAVDTAGDDEIGREMIDCLLDQTVAEESSMEGKNAVLASDTVTLEAVDTVGDDEIGREKTDCLLDQTVAEESFMEEKNAVLASDTVTLETVDTAGDDDLGRVTTDCLLDQTVAEESSMEEKNAVLASDTVTVEAVDTVGDDEIGREKTDCLLDQTVAEESSMEEKNAVLASDTVTLEAVDTAGDDDLGRVTTDCLLDQTVAEESSMEEKNAVVTSALVTVESVDTAGDDEIGRETTDCFLDQTIVEESSMQEKNAVLPSDTVTLEAVDTSGDDAIGMETTDCLLDQTVAEESSKEEKNAILASDTTIVEAVDTGCQDTTETETTDSLHDQTVAEKSSMEEKYDILAINTVTAEVVDPAGQDTIGTKTDSLLDQTTGEESFVEENAILASNTASVEGLDTARNDEIGMETTDCILDQTVAEESPIEKKNAILASNSAIVEAVDISGQDTIGTETTDRVLGQSVAEESSVEEKNAILDSDTGTLEAIDTTVQDTLGIETTDSLLDQTEDKANAESMMEVDCSDGTVQTKFTCSGELNNQTTLLSETLNYENDISNHIQCSHNNNDQTTEAQSVLVEAYSDRHIDTGSEVATMEAETSGVITNPDLKEIEPSDVTLLERGVQAISEVGEEGITRTQCQGLLVDSARTSTAVQAPPTSSVSGEKPESLTHQHIEVIASEQLDSMVESKKVGVSKEDENNEGSGRMSNLTQSMELSAEANKRNQDAKSSQILPESVMSTYVSHASEDTASKSGTMIDGKEYKSFPLSPKELQRRSHDGAPAGSLTPSVDLHMGNTSSDANEQGSSKTENVSSAEPKSDQTIPLVVPSTSGNYMDQQVKKHTGDSQKSTQIVEDCPASKGSTDAVDADAAGNFLLQPSKETVLEENLVTEVVNVPESRSILEEDSRNEEPNTNSLDNLGRDGCEEDNTLASSGVTTDGTSVSHPKGDVIKIGDFCASTSSDPFVKSHETGTGDAARNVGTPISSFSTANTPELQLNKTETDNVKKPEDQSTSSHMSVETPVLNRNDTNLTFDPRKAVEVSEAVNFSQATLVAPIVVGSPLTSSLEKTAPKSSKIKSERKPRRTPKSAGKETSRKGISAKGTTHAQHFQSGGKENAVNQSSASSIQITQSTEKQQSLQTPALNAFGNLSAPTASLPDLNSCGLSNILRRPFTDLQQVQLRAQIFVYGSLIQGTAPDEAYMISAFGGPDGGKIFWETAWRDCVVRAQKLLISTPETPLQSRKTEIPSASYTSSKESAAKKPLNPLSSPLWSLTTSLDTLQSSSSQRGSAHQPLFSSSHAHQTPPITNIVGHNAPWMSPLPYRNPWLASPQTSGFDGGSRIPVFPITEPVKLTPTKELSMHHSSAKHVLGGSSCNVFKGTPTLDPASTAVAPAQRPTGTKSRKRKKLPDSTESSPNILNSLKQTELAVSPLVSISTSVPITTAPGNLASTAGAMPNFVSFTSSPVNLVSTFHGKKINSSFPPPVFGGNLVPEVKQRSVLSEETINKLKEAKMYAEDASALATAAVSHSEHVWKQIEQQRHAGLQTEAQGKIASAAVAIAAAAAVAKAAAAAANVAANAALQAKLMAEEAFLPSASDQGNEHPKSNDITIFTIQGQGTPASILKGEGAVSSSNSVLIAAREASKRRVEAATSATKRAENMDSIVKAAELASEAVSQAGILVSMGHPPMLNKLVEAGPSNYWRPAQESHEAQPCKVGALEEETVGTSDGIFASPRTVPTDLDGSVRTADVVSVPDSATGKKTTGQKGHIGEDLAKNNAIVCEPEVGSKSLIDTQTESEQNMPTINKEVIKEGSHVEVFKEGPGLRTAWYSANVLNLENEKAYVLFNDLSVEQDKLKEWVDLKAEGDEAPKIRTARSVTAMPFEGTRKRRRSAIGDPVWKIGDRVDSWVHDSWLEGVITEKNKKDETTVTVHFPAQGDTLTTKAWNLRPSLLWKDGRWIEYSTSGEHVSSSHEGDTPKEKRPRLGAPDPPADGKDAKMKNVDDLDLEKQPQSSSLDLGVSENTFNIGRSTREDDKPNPLRTKRSGLQTQGSKSIFGVPKPGKKRKFMDVSKHYVSETSSRTRERKEPAKPVKSAVPQYTGPGSWRVPSKPISRDKQIATPKPRTLKPAPNSKDKPVTAARTIPRKDLRNTTASNMESDDAATVQSEENKGPASATTSSVPPNNSSSSSTNKGKAAAPAAGRLAKIEENKALAITDGIEPRRSIRKIQPTSRLLEGLQSSMMTSKIPSMSHSKSHQSQSKK
ncbi:unnamed protein product [Cochlearia groenlandica]